MVALVPEAVPIVGLFRIRFDPSAAIGVPAHNTVFYPFVAPDILNDQTLEILSQCFNLLSPIAFQVAGLRRFSGEGLYLARNPDEPFR